MSYTFSNVELEHIYAQMKLALNEADRGLGYSADRKTCISVLLHFKQVLKKEDLCLHPIIARLVDKETLEQMGAAKAD